jgi:hypothetical protein
MRFCDIKTVGELIDALQHYDQYQRVEIVYETHAQRRIESVETREGVGDHSMPVVRLIAENN